MVITGSPEQRQIQVFGCREHSEGSTGLWWAESVGRWRTARGADGPYCRGDSDLSPGWGEPWGRGNFAWSLGCSGGGGGGDRRQVRRRIRRAACCPSRWEEPCVCGGEPGAPRMWRNVCRKAPQPRPNYRREAAGHWGAWSRMCKGGVTGKRSRWTTGSFGGGSEAGGKGTPRGSLILGWRKGRGCRSCSCFRQDGARSDNLDSRGPCISPAWRMGVMPPSEGWSSGASRELQCLPRRGLTLLDPTQGRTGKGSLRKPQLKIRGSQR